MSVAEANRRFYATTAELYDRTEGCVVEPRLRAQLRQALERAVTELPDGARALDACGGSGNVSLMLFELGIVPLTVDISREMLAIYERKARALGVEPRTHVAEIDEFLRGTKESFDLIVFSSALHHLEDYTETLELACDRLAPGGVLLTAFDPTEAGGLLRAVRRLDYVAHVVVRTPRRALRLIAGRLRRREKAVPPSAGARAERHAAGGIDDLALADFFRTRGLTVLSHSRLYDGRFRVTRLALRIARAPSSFGFLVQRPPDR